MRYVIDLDGTLCTSAQSYEYAEPILDAIELVNQLWDNGCEIVIHTARGMGRQPDPKIADQTFRHLTERQLSDWGVKYDELVMGKPSGDRYVDDKGTSAADFFGGIKIVPKGWGCEHWIVNKPEYCGKLLYFEKGKRCSFHYHKIKDETFFVQSGLLIVHSSFGDDIAAAKTTALRAGERMHVPVGLRHQIIAVEDTELFEFSTQHFDEDSYRIIKGD